MQIRWCSHRRKFRRIYRRHAPEPPKLFRDSSDLDGTYLWLDRAAPRAGSTSQWDSTFGVDASFVRVREHEPRPRLARASAPAKWTSRGGGRVWADLMGTSLAATWSGCRAARCSSSRTSRIRTSAARSESGASSALRRTRASVWSRVSVTSRRSGYISLSPRSGVDRFGSARYLTRPSRGVAQSGSALGSGPRSRRFKSCRPDYNSSSDSTGGSWGGLTYVEQVVGPRDRRRSRHPGVPARLPCGGRLRRHDARRSDRSRSIGFATRCSTWSSST